MTSSVSPQSVSISNTLSEPSPAGPGGRSRPNGPARGSDPGADFQQQQQRVARFRETSSFPARDFHSTCIVAVRDQQSVRGRDELSRKQQSLLLRRHEPAAKEQRRGREHWSSSPRHLRTPGARPDPDANREKRLLETARFLAQEAREDFVFWARATWDDLPRRVGEAARAARVFQRGWSCAAGDRAERSGAAHLRDRGPFVLRRARGRSERRCRSPLGLAAVPRLYAVAGCFALIGKTFSALAVKAGDLSAAGNAGARGGGLTVSRLLLVSFVSAVRKVVDFCGLSPVVDLLRVGIRSLIGAAVRVVARAATGTSIVGKGLLLSSVLAVFWRALHQWRRRLEEEASMSGGRLLRGTPALAVAAAAAASAGRQKSPKKTTPLPWAEGDQADSKNHGAEEGGLGMGFEQ